MVTHGIITQFTVQESLNVYAQIYINFVFFMSYETLFFHVNSHGESTATRPPCTRHIFTDMVFKRHCLSARVVPQRSRQIQFRGSVRIFYHSPDRQGMQNYLCFIITKSSLCPVSFFHVELATPSKSQHRKHLLGEGFRTPRRPRPPSARSLGQAKGGGGGAHWPWDALRFTSVLSSARVPALPRSAAPAPFQRAPSRCHGNAQGASTPSLSGQTRARRASHSGLLPPPLLPLLRRRDSSERRHSFQAARAPPAPLGHRAHALALLPRAPATVAPPVVPRAAGGRAGGGVRGGRGGGGGAVGPGVAAERGVGRPRVRPPPVRPRRGEGPAGGGGVGGGAGGGVGSIHLV